MPFFVLRPEVAGSLGRNTVMTRNTHPPKVSHLHYEFDGWNGDDLLESFPCFIVTRRLAEALERDRLSGFELAAVQMSKSGEFEDLYSDQDLPEFVWLQVTGQAGVDDLGLDAVAHLVVSSRALAVLQRFHVVGCDIDDYV